jgi:hypothetical protein
MENMVKLYIGEVNGRSPRPKYSCYLEHMCVAYMSLTADFLAGYIEGLGTVARSSLMVYNGIPTKYQKRFSPAKPRPLKPDALEVILKGSDRFQTVFSAKVIK